MFVIRRFFTILSGIRSPADIKKLPTSELPFLAREIRKTIIEVVGKNGGHLASNLGVVELTIALHRVFSSPEDAIVWDVSHQCYAHKLLTGRYASFPTLRLSGGISGFTRRGESEHDFFSVGHASTSISSALGLLVSRDIQNKGGKVVAVIGDGALTGGMAFEALSHAGQLAKNLIVVLNDNQMSIDHNTGSISRYLSRMTMSAQYQTLRYKIDRFIDRVPYFNKKLEKLAFRFKRALKGMFLTNNLFVDLGFEYVGPLNGHDEQTLEKVFRRVEKLPRPVVVHVVTKKGKGYSPAEDNPERFHGIGPFLISDGTVEKFDALSFTESFSGALLALAEKDEKIVAVTAAMAKGTGLNAFARRYPNRFFDVGIAEEHVVTFAGALARGGLVPVVCIYSTFMQRAIDQMIHDIALQDVHVVFMLDRAGVVPGDGETHQGLFDIALLRPVPQLRILCPATAEDLKRCLSFAVESDGATVIRYPKLTCPSEQTSFSSPIEEGRGVIVSASDIAPLQEAYFEEKKAGTFFRTLFVCTGGMYAETLVACRSLLMKGIYADIYALRFIKPIDEEYFAHTASSYDGAVIVEDGVLPGGIASYLEAVLVKRDIRNVAVKAFADRFYPQGTRSEICRDAHMSSEDIAAAALRLAESRNA
ncbi:1-deoxy-D-xylulose-5-phosphate synthase [Treponema socranskii]|uniref:1-deoxy-D-xylulose-5-phosphate synthase n=1 Tax=Treponema socranskii TaxID=53419 RepID=UPI0028E4E3B3|nr:1-deoxy-D-xylulose-5-phosphate synthase [Treponema socranskii]